MSACRFLLNSSSVSVASVSGTVSRKASIRASSAAASCVDDCGWRYILYLEVDILEVDILGICCGYVGVMLGIY